MVLFQCLVNWCRICSQNGQPRPERRDSEEEQVLLDQVRARGGGYGQRVERVQVVKVNESPVADSTKVPETVDTLDDCKQQYQRKVPPQFLRYLKYHPRLDVEDALSYLEQVRYKFGSQPKVHKDFMKEFNEKRDGVRASSALFPRNLDTYFASSNG